MVEFHQLLLKIFSPPRLFCFYWMIVFGPLPNLRQIGREQKILFNKFCNAWIFLVIWYSSYIDPLKRYIFFLATRWWFFYYVVKIVLVFWLHIFHVVISDWHIFIENKLGNIAWHCVETLCCIFLKIWGKYVEQDVTHIMGILPHKLLRCI